MYGNICFRPIVPLLLAIMFGIAAGAKFSGHGVSSCFVIAFAACIIIYTIKNSPGKSFGGNTVFPVLLFFALGYLSIQPWVSSDFPSNHIANFSDNNRKKVAGIIDSRPVVSKKRIKFILRAIKIEDKNRTLPVTGKIRVTVFGNAPELFAGDTVLFDGKIRLIRNFNNPGGFDYQRYMAFKGIRASSSAQGKRLLVIKRNTKTGLFYFIEDCRGKVADLINKADLAEKFGQKSQTGVLKALIIGDKNYIPQYTRETFNRAGVAHLLAISGLHIGIVATVAFIFFSWLLSYIKPFLWNAWTKKGAAILSLIPVLLYGLLSGMSPSTQRAVIMVTVFLMAFLFEKQHDPINTLAVAAMLILVVNPPSLFSVSFQLSFAAVFSIIYGLSKIYRGTDIQADINAEFKKNRSFLLLEKLYSFFLVSLFAVLGTMPLVCCYFNQVSLAGLFTNFLLVPLVGFIVVPIGLLAVFIYPVSLCAASWCMNLSSLVLSYSCEIVKLFAKLPFVYSKVITPSFFEICCFYLLGWALLNIKEFGGQKAISVSNTGDLQPPQKHKRTDFNTRKIAIIVAVATIIAGCADACYWLNIRFWHNDLRVTIIDVGQGSAALLEFPKGAVFLIDGGGFADNSIFDMGARVVAPFLWHKKIKTVDTIILSHPNSDHLNGLLYIAENFHVKNVWTNNEAVNTFGYKRFIKIIKKNNICMPNFKDIPCKLDINGVDIKIVYPPKDFLDKREKESWRNLNNNSMVIKVLFGTKSFLFAGDIQARAERELVGIKGDELKSTVLVVPHHGSKTSSTALFLEKTGPEFAITSSGWKNRFKFPHPSVLRRYEKQGCRILRTDINGAIAISTDGKSINFKPFIKDS